MTHNLWVILGLLGIVVLRYPARLVFNRRNQYGIEEFASYSHMRRRRWLERGMKLAGLALIIVALQHGCMSTRHYAPMHGVGVPVSRKFFDRPPGFQTGLRGRP